MTQLILELPELYYSRLENEAKRAGIGIEKLILDWISKLPEADETFDITSDPLYNFEGFETDAPDDLSLKADEYLYAEKV